MIKPRYYAIVLSFFLIVPHCVFAQGVYEFNTACQRAYLSIVQLQLSPATAQIAIEKQRNTNNLIPLFLENYVDFLTLFFSQSPAEYNVRLPNIDKRIDALGKGAATSPFRNYCLSEAYLQKACIAMRLGKSIQAGMALRTSYQLIKDNVALFPTFAPNNLLYGGLQAVVGSIPSNYSFFAGIFGLKGSLPQGIQMVQNFTHSSDPYARLMSNEAALFYSILLFYIDNKKDEALSFLCSGKIDLVNNDALAYFAANMARNNKKTALAISIIKNRNQSATYLATPVWNLEMGFNYLNHLEYKSAIDEFTKFLTTFKGTTYIKTIYEKLSWCAYLQGDVRQADFYRQQLFAKGSAEMESDKTALIEAKKDTWPNKQLLRARLLSDGGYNQDALNTMLQINYNSLVTTQQRIEFPYRMGRVYDDMHNDTAAISWYLKALQAGKASTLYFAARAALQIGEVYERNGKREQAITFFKICLNMANHDYKYSLDQQAQSGLVRCNANK